MRREEISQIVLSTQCAHNLGDRQFGKNTMGFQAERQEIGEHCNQQSGVQTVALSLHRANMENRFENLPETFHHMMLLPHVPRFRTSQRRVTKMHQIIAARGPFPKKEENQ